MSTIPRTGSNWIIYTTSFIVITLAISYFYVSQGQPTSTGSGIDKMVTPAQLNVVVIGGSYVGCNIAQKLAAALPATHRVLLIEPHSHFHHLFAFPRFAILPSHEHKAFIPYSGLFSTLPTPNNHSIIQAKVTKVLPNSVQLDRPYGPSNLLELQASHVIIATGTKIPSPGSMNGETKISGVEYFKKHQQDVEKAKKISIIGGGAVGVQMSLDIAEIYAEEIRSGEKRVRLIHSREEVMSRFHNQLDGIVMKRCEELGVELILGSRVVLPPSTKDGGNGYPDFEQGKTFDVLLQNGTKIETDLVIMATGQTPNSGLLSHLGEEGINPLNSYIKVLPTLQLQQPTYSSVYALGDVADIPGAAKAARPAGQQAETVVENVLAQIKGDAPGKVVEVGPAAIHMSLGLKENVVFRNPDPKEEGSVPWSKPRDDGTPDMGIEGVWTRRNVIVRSPSDYHL